jgi:hypothetical protein
MDARETKSKQTMIMGSADSGSMEQYSGSMEQYSGSMEQY